MLSSLYGADLKAVHRIGILVAAQPCMKHRRNNGAGTLVVGHVLFPVTLPAGMVRGTVASSVSSRNDSGEAFLARPSPRLPRHDGLQSPAVFGAASLLFHAAVIAALVAVVGTRGARTPEADRRQAVAARLEMPRLVVLMEPARPGPGGGGGGGGNRQWGPIPRARARGRDVITLPIAKPVAPTTPPPDEDPLPQAVALDAKPLASALDFQIGSLDGSPTLNTSQGRGSGGGVGDGVGTGIGSGRGPGVGPGSGGGTGGGVYRPGGAVTAPTLLREVKPTYTAEALRAKIQGSVLLEVIVQRDGTPRDIRIIGSLDRDGLDRQAVLAVEQWRFVAGRLNGTPVDVLATIILDFHIR